MKNKKAINYNKKVAETEKLDQSINTITKEDIEKAVQDAEKFAEEDKKRKEAVDTRNAADQMV